nr:hypothetical protein CFP56_57672 [Quercus suber]
MDVSVSEKGSGEATHMMSASETRRGFQQDAEPEVKDKLKSQLIHIGTRLSASTRRKRGNTFDRPWIAPRIKSHDPDQRHKPLYEQYLRQLPRACRVVSLPATQAYLISAEVMSGQRQEWVHLRHVIGWNRRNAIDRARVNGSEMCNVNISLDTLVASTY